jgi:hypothetical protein
VDNGKGRAMRVGCFVTDHLRIHRVTLHASGELPNLDKVFSGVDEGAAYSGPNFDELDQALQNGFYEYLAARGVDDSLCERLADFCAAKEQAEYVNWLGGAASFVKGQ